MTFCCLLSLPFPVALTRIILYLHYVICDVSSLQSKLPSCLVPEGIKLFIFLGNLLVYLISNPLQLHLESQVLALLVLQCALIGGEVEGYQVRNVRRYPGSREALPQPLPELL